MVQMLIDNGQILLVDDLCSTYNGILGLHGASDNLPNKMLKALILKHFPSVEITRPYRIKCEQICSSATKDAATGLFRAVRGIRQQIKELR